MSNLIIKNAAQVVTCKSNGAKFGKDMSDINMLENASIVAENGLIKDIDTSENIAKKYDETKYDVIDATNKAVLPGFVDSHTHFVFGGYRADEFSWRLRGDSYMDIMNRGGGIVNSVTGTRCASEEELIQLGKKRLDEMLSFGVTSVEGKSGYGLDKETELKQLRVMKKLNEIHPIDISTTFMGAHATPKEFAGKTDDYVDFIINEVLPEVANQNLAEFFDVFCEQNVFSVEQSRKMYLKAKQYGMKLKIHADEIVQLGGAELAAELDMISADHLLHASDEGIKAMAQKKVINTLLPTTAFCLKEPFARARYMIDSNGAVALGTDFNPGSNFTNSIPLMFALACIYMNMSIEEAVNAMTINGAAAIDKADTVGSIQIGNIKISFLQIFTISYRCKHSRKSNKKWKTCMRK